LANFQRAFSKTVHAFRAPFSFSRASVDSYSHNGNNGSSSSRQKKKGQAKKNLSDEEAAARRGVSLEGRPISVDVVDQRVALFHIVDILVRLKYLNLLASSNSIGNNTVPATATVGADSQRQATNNSTGVVKAAISSKPPSLAEVMEMKNELVIRAREELGITDLHGLAKDVEVAIVAARALANYRDQNNRAVNAEGDGVNSAAFLAGLKQRIIKSSNAYQDQISKERSLFSLSMLCENLPILEEELYREVGYKVTQSSADALVVLKDFQSREFSERLIFIGKVLGAAGVVATGMVLIVKVLSTNK
jgi:hypothetical protein